MASSFDLVALADLKAWLDIQSDDDDALLATLITQTSRLILTHIDRAVLPVVHAETRDGGKDSCLILRQWPVTEILSLTIDGRVIAAAAPQRSGYVLESASHAPPGRMQKVTLRGMCFASGEQIISIRYRAGYLIPNEAALVPLSAPYTIAAQAPYGAWASDCGVAYADGTELVAVAASPAAGEYSVAAGSYQFSEADADKAVALSYGYVPADLAFCCMDWAAELYAYRNRIGQQSKSLGGQETVSFIVKDIPDFVATALQPYRRVVTP